MRKAALNVMVAVILSADLSFTNHKLGTATIY